MDNQENYSPQEVADIVLKTLNVDGLTKLLIREFNLIKITPKKSHRLMEEFDNLIATVIKKSYEEEVPENVRKHLVGKIDVDY